MNESMIDHIRALKSCSFKFVFQPPRLLARFHSESYMVKYNRPLNRLPMKFLPYRLSPTSLEERNSVLLIDFEEVVSKSSFAKAAYQAHSQQVTPKANR